MTSKDEAVSTAPEVEPGPELEPKRKLMPNAELMIVAGEASGDLHAAHVMEHLRELVPGVRFCGLGGERMKAVGMLSVGNSRDIAVVGLVEVLRILPKAKRFMDDLVALAEERRPAAALLVDAPDFNLRLAKKLAALGIPVVYYVSPQLWAWRKGRVNAMRDVIHRMLVLFPFEVQFYLDAGIDVTHVGHPLLDVVPELHETGLLNLATGSSADWIVGLLPGSRNSEVGRNLPGMLEAAKMLAHSAGTKTRLLLASTVSREMVIEAIRKSDLDETCIEIVDATCDQERFESIRECRLCLCASGTATLEVGLLEVPMVVSYRLAPLTYFVARRLVKLDHVSLVNLVLEQTVVPELIQQDAEPANLASVALDILVDGQKRTRMLDGLSRLRRALGAKGASKKAARAVAEVLGSRVNTNSAGPDGHSEEGSS